MSLLQVDVREKAFGDTVVLQDIRLGLGDGEAAVLLGPSGCGKSTLLRIAAGLDRRFAGAVTINTEEEDGATDTPPIAFVFQEPRLMPWLTVAENIGYAAGKKFDVQRVEGLINDVGLSGHGAALPKALSGGMAQRVAIARALYTQPRILLLDEPFSAVDAFTRMKLQDLVLKLVEQRGISFLLVTHDIDEALYLGDRIYMMGAHDGRIQEEIEVDVPRPRDRRSPRLATLKNDVLTALHKAHVI
ncbi:ABC transporter ATP-binding protein [Agrobacterium pusense]|uniref:Sulfonate ABC transporter, ATP binding protein (SsuB/tauB/ycbE-like) n=1 Tax=Agrobacterium pusense TaxID=648995 RepID=U4Q1J1_9HYPH|nr:ABC transporter ATP-binding protein [Agrobacterium pusense]MBW9060803.1 ABC transporter ATP-binding protein [Agrobacterium pusense]QKJ92587.1 ABC transporter ATP-binding protein [Agrobacterium pusense]CDI09878.1 putative sulfonate ABC transporter, ATP binding protein (ssuB/tauB/ycbE-like) [Agrobacterium pusense]